MKWCESLWKDPEQGKISHSRFLSLAAFLVASWILIRMELRGATQYELVLGYLTVMVTGEVWKRTSMSNHRTEVERERIRHRVDNPDA